MEFTEKRQAEMKKEFLKIHPDASEFVVSCYLLGVINGIQETYK